LQPSDDRCANNLRQIALAIHFYHDAYAQLPTVASFDKNGKPLLSWRANLLPFLDQDSLYREFNPNEPWDSEHNKKLIPRMPDVYRCPNQKLADKGKTTYVLPVGPPGKSMTLFSGSSQPRILGRDTGDTIMLLDVDDDHAVTWTKPEDLNYNPDEPMAGLVGHHSGLIAVAFGNGSGRFLKNTIDKEKLKTLFTFNGGATTPPLIRWYQGGKPQRLPGPRIKPPAFASAPARAQVDEEAATREWIEKTMGGHAVGRPITSVWLPPDPFQQAPGEALKRIAGLKHVKELSLTGPKVTDAALRELVELKNLRSLGLADTKVTDAGLKELARLQGLESLYLEGTLVTFGGMKELADLGKLQTLCVGRNDAAATALKNLSRLSNLRSLTLRAGCIDEAAIKDLALLKELDSLTLVLARSAITDGTLRSLHEAKLLHGLPSAQGDRQIGWRRPARDEEVVFLGLLGTVVTDSGLKELAGLTNLRWLDVRETKVSGTGIKDLAGLERLETIQGQISDEMLRGAREAGLLQALSVARGSRVERPARTEDVIGLDLRDCRQVTDAGLKELTGMNNLQSLDLSNTGVTDAGLKQLSGFKNLNSLNLMGTVVTDAGLKDLAGFKNLTSLNLYATRVTNVGLKELTGLKKLDNLFVARTRVTAAGLSEFAKLKSHSATVKKGIGEPLLISAKGLPSGQQLFRFHADGSGRWQLTFEQSGVGDAGLSPDGKWIACVTGDGLCVMNADGSGRKRVAKRGDLATVGVCWSPDGRRIAFSVVYRGATGGSLHSRLYTVDVDGQDLRPVGDTEGICPVWSPDGKRLLFTGMGRKDEGGGLYITHVDGTNVRQLVKDALMGAWSPDGQWLAYVTFTDREAGSLYVARADGSQPRQLLRTSREPLFGPQWSADGQRLFFTRRLERGRAAVCVIDSDGRNNRRLTAEDSAEYLAGTVAIANWMMGR
jgi:Leucine-rich repeat (LRR) protein